LKILFAYKYRNYALDTFKLSIDYALDTFKINIDIESISKFAADFYNRFHKNRYIGVVDISISSIFIKTRIDPSLVYLVRSVCTN